MDVQQLRIGLAGWALRREHQDLFGPGASHLARYATRFDCVEINSSFYRPHRPKTYRSWAEVVPPHFSFAVKMPRALTHDARLIDTAPLLEAFFEQVTELGEKLGIILVQLPPRLEFDARRAEAFWKDLRKFFHGRVACEPRHESWFSREADQVLYDFRVARVAADPPPVRGAEHSGGWDGFTYVRLHGSPRIYYSRYPEAYLDRLGEALTDQTKRNIPSWCIFDNTAIGHATGDALALQTRLRPS